MSSKYQHSISAKNIPHTACHLKQQKQQQTNRNKVILRTSTDQTAARYVAFSRIMRWHSLDSLLRNKNYFTIDGKDIGIRQCVHSREQEIEKFRQATALTTASMDLGCKKEIK